MKMPTKQSDRVIMMFLPAAVILLGYALFVHRGLQREYKLARSRYDSANEKAAAEQDVLMTKTKLAAATRQRNHLQEAVDQHQAKRDRICQRLGDVGQQLAVVERIEELAVDRSMALVKQEEASRPELSEPVTRVLERIEKGNNGKTLQYRRYQFRGRYGNMVLLVRELTDSTPGVLPLAVELDATDSLDGVHTWELLVVM